MGLGNRGTRLRCNQPIKSLIEIAGVRVLELELSVCSGGDRREHRPRCEIARSLDEVGSSGNANHAQPHVTVAQGIHQDRIRRGPEGGLDVDCHRSRSVAAKPIRHGIDKSVTAL